MTRLAILSDLHFGLERADLVTPLIEAVNATGADLVLLPGDLTHRARSAEYAQAASFLGALSAPWIAVPGNHDVPLYHLWARLTRPYRNWHRFVTRDMLPVMYVGHMRIIGINSVDPRAWQRGVVSPQTRERLAEALLPQGRNVVMAHHQMEQDATLGKEPTLGAPLLIAQLEARGGAILITGHVHRWEVDRFLDGHPQGRGVLQIQTGTALCDRPGDVQNEFAVLDLTDEGVTIARHISPMDGPPVFQPPVTTRYRCDAGLWTKAA